MRLIGIAVLALGLTACQKDSTTDPNPDPTDPANAEDPAAAAKDPKATAGDIPAPPDVAKPPADAKKTAKGVSYKMLGTPSTDGDNPTPNDTVEVHYTGWTTDGKMFDSSKKRGKPAKFQLTKVIPGWTDGLQVMKKGDKTRFWIPEKLAYAGRKGAPQGMLVFDVELLSVQAAPKPPADVAAPPPDAKKTRLGVFYKVLKPGSGAEKPRPQDKVKVHYTGWTTDGNMFDSSVSRGRPAEFALSGVIPGWTDGLQVMSINEKTRFWIPEEHAYKGKQGAPQGMLVFDVELLNITKMPDPPEVPKDVAKPPKGAKKTEKGVFYKVLKPGTGKAKPTPTSKVQVHYSGWTTDGKMFDSSVTRGQPITFGLNSVIPGWTDGMQTMTVGGKTRFWIPEELAYKGKPNRPQGMLVFDVELLAIDPPAQARPQKHP